MHTFKTTDGGNAMFSIEDVARLTGGRGKPTKVVFKDGDRTTLRNCYHYVAKKLTAPTTSK